MFICLVFVVQVVTQVISILFPLVQMIPTVFDGVTTKGFLIELVVLLIFYVVECISVVLAITLSDGNI